MRRIIFSIIIFILGLAILGGIIWGVSLLPIFHQSNNTTSQTESNTDDTLAPDSSMPEDNAPATNSDSNKPTESTDSTSTTSTTTDTPPATDSNLPSTGPDTVSGTFGALALSIIAFLAVNLYRQRKSVR